VSVPLLSTRRSDQGALNMYDRDFEQLNRLFENKIQVELGFN
jgi:hypothetical protein